MTRHAPGCTLLLLSFFLTLFDGFRWRRVFTPFIWIGMNPISLYLVHHVINSRKIFLRV